MTIDRGETISRIKDWPKEDLVEEVLHFQEVASLVLPRKKQFPHLSNIDYFLAIEPLKGCVGGDHIIVVNFDEYHLEERIAAARNDGDAELASTLEKNRDRFGILIADAAGHMVSDSVTVNYLHAAFKIGVAYELTLHGEITRGLFEMLNTNFYNHSTPEFLKGKPYITLIYGEVKNDGRFRFLSAGHPPPIVFSNEYDKIVVLDGVKNSTPLGIFPSQYHVNGEQFNPAVRTKTRYPVNEITLLGAGDILLLYTDGLSEQHEGRSNFCETHLEETLRENKSRSAREISAAIRQSLRRFCPPEDDLAMIVIKKL